MRDADMARRAHQLYTEVRVAIQEGELRPGDRLPGERVLALRHGISRMAVKRMLEILAAEGLVYRMQGKGTFVQENRLERLRIFLQPEKRPQGIGEIMRAQGRCCRTRLVGAGFLPSCEFFSERLGLNGGEGIFAVRRVRMEKDEPVALENSYLPCKYAPGVEEIDFSRTSLYEYLNSIGRGVRRCERVVRAARAGRREAELLRIPEGQTILVMENIGKTSAGLIVEYTESFLLPDRIELFAIAEG